MSKTFDAEARCPRCDTVYEVTLFSTIWIEFPENRAKIENDELNVITCPSCHLSLRAPVSVMATNSPADFSAWYEPVPDPDIDAISDGFAHFMGKNSHMATAPRVRDWDEFKAVIARFESVTVPGEPAEKLESPSFEERAEGARTVKLKVSCASCNEPFDALVVETIDIDIPTYRDLVFADQVNVFACPHCGKGTRAIRPFLAKNLEAHLSVWYEPVSARFVEEQLLAYRGMVGDDNYLSNPPRVKTLEELKATILKFESGELVGKPIQKFDPGGVPQAFHDGARPKPKGFFSKLFGR